MLLGQEMEYKWTFCEHRQQRKQCNGEKSIHKYMGCPDQAWGKSIE